MRSWAGSPSREIRPAPICTKSAKRATMPTGALHQSHFSNTEDTDNNHNVGRPMRVSALSMRWRQPQRVTIELKRGSPRTALHGEES